MTCKLKIVISERDFRERDFIVFDRIIFFVSGKKKKQYCNDEILDRLCNISIIYEKYFSILWSENRTMIIYYITDDMTEVSDTNELIFHERQDHSKNNINDYKIWNGNSIIKIR